MKVLVIQIGRYGDVILTTPLLQALKDHYRTLEIHVLASRKYHDVLEYQSLVDVVHVYKKNVLDMMQSFHNLRSQKFELLIDPKDHYSQESMFFARVIKSETSIGFNTEKKSMYTYSVPSITENDSHDPPLHAVERNLNPLKFLGITALNHRPRLEVSRMAINRTFDIIPTSKTHERLVVLSISAGQPVRVWQMQKWLTLGRALQAPGIRLVILAAPDDHANARKLAHELGRNVILSLSQSIHETIAMISRADLLVTSDSAPVHIASAFDIPVVALYNSVMWNLYKFHPLSTRQEVVQPQISSGEIADINEDDVVSATQRLLGSLPKKAATVGKGKR